MNMKITKTKAKEIRSIIEDCLKTVYSTTLVTSKQKEFFEMCEEKIRGIRL